MAGLRLDKALSTHPEIESRSQATNLIENRRVLLNNTPVKASHKVRVDQVFTVIIDLAPSTEIVPYSFPLDIAFEDEYILVINKPSGLVVHPSAGHEHDTLVNALFYHSKKLASGSATSRPGIVHRIDKDTSGLIVVAKDDKSLRFLADQFKNKTVHRVYWALTYGAFTVPENKITTYLRRHPTDRKKFASEKNVSTRAPLGKLAITKFAVKKTNPSGISLVNCQLETGRTHQIRVHLSELGHPIVGDPIYCSSHRLNSIRSVSLRKILAAAPHLMLHAAELGFIHPVTKKNISFTAPWPTETHYLLRELNFL